MSIGTVGGAEGPASVLVMSTLNPTWYFIVAAVIIAAVAGFAVWKRRTHKGMK